MGTKIAQLGILLAAIMLMSMIFVPAVSAASKESMEKWTKEHTVKNVKLTKIYKYEEGYLQINEIYSGNELKKKTGVNKLNKEMKIPLETGTFMMNNGNDKLIVTENELVVTSKKAGTFKLEKGKEKVYTTKISLVMTHESNPYPWWDDYDGPQWTWSKFLWFYVREDPINLIWEEPDIDIVKEEILDEGWVDNPSEYTHYVYDQVKGWIKDDGVAETRYRLFGGDHARLWKISTGEVNLVIANTHHDDGVFNWPLGHQAVEYEVVEDWFGDFYALNGWTVYDDVCPLDNEYTNEYGADNDGDATVITAN